MNTFNLLYKFRCFTIILILSITCGFTQVYAEEKKAESEPVEVPKISTEELETLVAPIALYPDDLLAQVLTASSVPLDVVKAARYQEQNKGVTQPPKAHMEAWEPSVVSLMMFPDTLKMMYDKLEWTEQLGAALYAQEEDVYNAIQRLRSKAADVGHLQSNDKQVIVKEKEVIKIVPADPEIIYVPVYDPQVIYVPSTTVVVSRPDPWITFGVGIAVGVGLSYAFDWHHHHVVHHHHWGRRGHHHHHYHRRHPPRHSKAWRPPPPPRPPRPGYRPPRPPHARPKPGHLPARPPHAGSKPPKPKPPGVKPPGHKAPRNNPQKMNSRNKPSNSAVKGYNRGSEVRKNSNRGKQSQMGGRQTRQPSRANNRGSGGRGGGNRR